MFKKLSGEPHHEKKLLTDCMVILLIVVTGVFFLRRHKALYSYSTFMTVYIFQAQLSVFLLVLPFIRILENLKSRIEITKEIMYRLCTSDDDENRRRLHSSIKLVRLLCHTCEIVNDIFSQQLLYSIFSSFQSIAVLSYFFVSVYSSIGPRTHKSMLISFYVILIWRIISICSKISEEVSDT